MFKHRLCGHLTHLRILNGNEDEGHKRSSEDCHSDIHHQIDVGHLRGSRHRSDQCTHEHRGHRTGEGVQRSTNHVQLVTTVTTTAQQVQHRVHHGIQDTDGETGDECTEEIDAEAGDATRET